MTRSRSRLGAASLLVFGGLALAAGSANAQMFHLYLKCQGKIAAQHGTFDAHIDLALRDNNQTALVQKSNVLPVGERLRYVPTDQAYSMTYKAPPRTVAAYRAWWGGPLFVWYPSLTRLATVRMSVDRQTADLSGQLLNLHDEVLATLAMQCTPSSVDDQPPPRF